MTNFNIKADNQVCTLIVSSEHYFSTIFIKEVNSPSIKKGFYHLGYLNYGYPWLENFSQLHCQWVMVYFCASRIINENLLNKDDYNILFASNIDMKYCMKFLPCLWLCCRQILWLFWSMLLYIYCLFIVIAWQNLYITYCKPMDSVGVILHSQM